MKKSATLHKQIGSKYLLYVTEHVFHADVFQLEVFHCFYLAKAYVFAQI